MMQTLGNKKQQESIRAVFKLRYIYIYLHEKKSLKQEKTNWFHTDEDRQSHLLFNLCNMLGISVLDNIPESFLIPDK